MIKPGQKVICIVKPGEWYTWKKVWFMTFKFKSRYNNPEYGKIYTVRDVDFNNPHKVWVCSLEEISGTWMLHCFKPAQEDFAEEVCENAIKEAKEEEKQLIEELTNI